MVGCYSRAAAAADHDPVLGVVMEQAGEILGSYAGDAFVFISGARVVAWACFWAAVLGVA